MERTTGPLTARPGHPREHKLSWR